MGKDKLLIIAIKAALKAGEAINTIYNSGDDIEVKLKLDESPITKADKTAHNIIVDMLSCYDYPVLSEEGVDLSFSKRESWNSLWIVDPLDGTKEFIKRNGEFTVNIAFVVNKKPILGVIYAPVSKKLYFASNELGAFRLSNVDCHTLYDSIDELIAMSDKLPIYNNTPRDNYVIVASRSHLSQRTKEYIEKLKQTNTKVNLLYIGSSIKMCLVAEGSADLYPRFEPTMEWDTAAGHAILTAANSQIYLADSPKETLTYNKEDLYNPWFIVES